MSIISPKKYAIINGSNNSTILYQEQLVRLDPGISGAVSSSKFIIFIHYFGYCIIQFDSYCTSESRDKIKFNLCSRWNPNWNSTLELDLFEIKSILVFILISLLGIFTIKERFILLNYNHHCHS